MSTTTLSIQSVAVIGAGVSGVAAGVHLKRAGLNVTVFERTNCAGGVWVFDERTAKEAPYPSVLPSIGDSPSWEAFQKCYQGGTVESSYDCREDRDARARSRRKMFAAFAPPGPCYASLRNNVSTTEMEVTFQKWPPGTQEFVPHHVLADYIQEAVRSGGLSENIRFGHRVERVQKVDDAWQVEISSLKQERDELCIFRETLDFDAVVVASGHYHACNIPDIPGLSEWKRAYPDRVQHSKSYRSASDFDGKKVLLVGGGVSSMDIARDLGGTASVVIQSTRGGRYDLPTHMLPENATRVGPIKSFNLSSAKRRRDSILEVEVESITLAEGSEICGIDHVILCTGYHVSFPYMRQYHADGTQSADADETVLVTDGQQTHNLHKDIWYIPDPSLAFVGVPYHVATFSAFEFQAMALAAVFSGRIPLPELEDMRQEYAERLLRKGPGRSFHSLKEDGEEVTYVEELCAMVNGGERHRSHPLIGHTDKWHMAYHQRLERRDKMLAAGSMLPAPLKPNLSVVQC